MANQRGTLKDRQGNILHPETTAEMVMVRTGGDDVPLSAVLAGIGGAIDPTEVTATLQGALDPGDLYTVPAYTPGGGHIQIWMDGAYAPGGEAGAWQEYADAGIPATLVRINETIDAGMVITVRVSG